MLDSLYLIIIKPIIMLLEFLFQYLHVEGCMDVWEAVCAISFIISSLCLPFYIKAEKLQKEEKNIQEKMADRVKCIKKNFKGDARYFMLQTCYRQNNYHPVMSLRLSLSLLLQIPFFLAAYIFFSHLPQLNMADFLYVTDMAKPDKLFAIGSFSVNLLPILMTIINLASGYIYTGDFSFGKNKAQIFISLLFLILLYNSPAGLVLYWTANNLFALFKNIFLRCQKEKILYITISTIITISYFIYLLYNASSLNILWFLSLIVTVGLFFDVPGNAEKISLNFPTGKLFCLSALFLWILLGILIPTNVFSSSPTEFFLVDEASSMQILTETALIFFGAFIFWGSCVFYVLSKEEKKYFSLLYCILSIMALLNLHFWQLPNIPLLNDLTFNASSRFIVFTSAGILQNICYYAVLLLVLLFIFLSIKKKFVILQNFMLIIIFSMLIFASINTHKIAAVFKNYVNKPESYGTSVKLINLSRTHKNVVFFFIDRAISSFFPMVVEEHPELKETYRGFNFYPNTVSFAKYSILGYLPMFGGYEYTPQNIDERKIDFLIKHNEAVTMLARIFKENNYDATIVHTVNDAWWEGVSQNGKHKPIQYNDLYEKYDIKTLTPPKFQLANRENNEKNAIEISKRNMVYFSIMSTLPEKGKKYLYDKGQYHSLTKEKKSFYTQETYQYYKELQNLINFTEISSDKNTYTNINNWLVHYPGIFQLPNYELDEQSLPNSSVYNASPQLGKFSVKTYHACAASFILVGKWLDYLKKEGIYDNTRIIIVSDHGFFLQNSKELPFFNTHVFPINPTLLVKDFNSNEELKLDNYQLMTNADAPFFAIKDIIKNPKNPFTGKALSQADKEKGLYIKINGEWHPKDYLDKNEVLTDTDKFAFLKGNGNPQEEDDWQMDVSTKELKEAMHQD